jgi:hypothetical protein
MEELVLAWLRSVPRIVAMTGKPAYHVPARLRCDDHAAPIAPSPLTPRASPPPQLAGLRSAARLGAAADNPAH